MFGVGPGALVGDAFRMNRSLHQRDRMNEALDVILPLLRVKSYQENGLV